MTAAAAAARQIETAMFGHSVRRHEINMIHTRTRPWCSYFDKDVFSAPDSFALTVYLLVNVQDVKVPSVDASVEAFRFQR